MDLNLLQPSPCDKPVCPQRWSLDEDEGSVGQEEHESVVEQKVVEESFPTEDEVEDVCVSIQLLPGCTRPTLGCTLSGGQ